MTSILSVGDIMRILLNNYFNGKLIGKQKYCVTLYNKTIFTYHRRFEAS